MQSVKEFFTAPASRALVIVLFVVLLVVVFINTPSEKLSYTSGARMRFYGEPSATNMGEQPTYNFEREAMSVPEPGTEKNNSKSEEALARQLYTEEFEQPDERVFDELAALNDMV